jgi:hypothetical protein
VKLAILVLGFFVLINLHSNDAAVLTNAWVLDSLYDVDAHAKVKKVTHGHREGRQATKK